MCMWRVFIFWLFKNEWLTKISFFIYYLHLLIDCVTLAPKLAAAHPAKVQQQSDGFFVDQRLSNAEIKYNFYFIRLYVCRTPPPEESNRDSWCDVNSSWMQIVNLGFFSNPIMWITHISYRPLKVQVFLCDTEYSWLNKKKKMIHNT